MPHNNRSTPVRVLALRSVDGHGGGADAVLLRTASRLDRQRVCMTLCTIHRAGDGAYDFDRRSTELGLDHLAIEQRSILARGVFTAIRQVVRERQIAIVNAQDYKATFFAWLLARREATIPVATFHGWSGHHWRERLVYYPAERRIARRFPMTIAVSSEIRDVLTRRGGRPGQVAVLLNGVDPAALRRTADGAAEARSVLGIGAADVVVGSVGRLEREKRFDLLLEALARLLPRRPELRLLVAGDGSLKRRLEEQSQRLGIQERCCFLGHRQNIAEFYQAMDVFVQASDHEGTPTVLLEAMALEVPVVATDVGGTRELIEHGRHGLLVRRRDVAALAAAIESTLTDRQSTAGRIAAARRRIEDELSLDARTRRLEEIYEDVAQRMTKHE